MRTSDLSIRIIIYMFKAKMCTYRFLQHQVKLSHVGRTGPVDPEVTLSWVAVAHPEFFEGVKDVRSQDPQQVVEFVGAGQDGST